MLVYTLPKFSNIPQFQWKFVSINNACIYTFNILEYSSIGPFLYNAGLKMRPKFNTVSSQPDLSCANWIEDASYFSSLEPFLCNSGLKMRPKFNTVSSQPDLSCAIEDAS